LQTKKMSMISRSLSVSSDLKAASQYSQWLPELTERADRERKRERERASEKRERERERERCAANWCTGI
jgi:hypothetical protein